MADEPDHHFLHIFEVETPEGTKHLVGFIDPVTAEAEGIDERCIVGEFEPGPDGEFDVNTFELNPDFLSAFIDYMNDGPIRSEEVIEHARTIPGEPLYIVDPRNKSNPEIDPPSHDILGVFQIDEGGQVVPDSFDYNTEYQWFSTEAGVSGLLDDPRFYEWMHQ